jgi:four helix bundle protein
MRRAAVSIPSNISEGAARSGKKEFIRFLYVALGSLAELETQTIIAEKLGYLKNHRLMELIEKQRRKQLNFIKYLKGIEKS